MRLNDDLLDGVSAEYALGTLRGQARSRMERQIADDARTRSAVWNWESNLGGLAELVPPQAPPASVWQAIYRRIQGTATANTTAWWNRWLVALPITALALLLAAVLTWQPAPEPQAPVDRVAVVTGAEGQSLWVISASTESGILQARADKVTAAESGKVYELWLLPPDGTPRSLGLLPTTGSTERTLPAATLAFLVQTQGLAVSIEPTGGSPTGLPTGPVVYQAALTSL